MITRLDRCNENTDLFVTAAFADEDGAAVTPTAATLRVDDDASGQAMVAEAALSGLAASMVLRVPAAANTIVDSTRSTELRKLTVQFTYGTGKRGTAEYRYELVNLKFVSSTLSPA